MSRGSSRKATQGSELAVLRRAVVRHHQAQLELAEALDLVKQRQLYQEEGYQSLDDFCRRALCLLPSTASWLLRNLRAARSAGISRSDLEAIGMSRVSVISGKVNRFNRDELIEAAKSMDIEALELAFMDDADGDDLVDLRFRVHKDQRTFIEAILESYAGRTGSNVPGQQLVYALLEAAAVRLMRSGRNRFDPEVLLAAFERQFGGRVVWFQSTKLPATALDELVAAMDRIIGAAERPATQFPEEPSAEDPSAHGALGASAPSQSTKRSFMDHGGRL